MPVAAAASAIAAAASRHSQSILDAACRGDVPLLAAVSDDDLRNAVCTSGSTALHWAAGTPGQWITTRYLLQERGHVFATLAEVIAAAVDHHHHHCGTTDDDNNNTNVSVVVTAVNVPVHRRQKAAGRTPLHYACRNGCLDTVRGLVEQFGANVHVRAKHGVTPFQLAVWRNHLAVCQYLVYHAGVRPCEEINDFQCGVVHWLGISPIECADCPIPLPVSKLICGCGTDDNPNDEIEDRPLTGHALLPLARWLAQQPGIDFMLKQKQGHTALHKAAWLGHLALVQYLHREHGMWDVHTDHAGNYAADLADMANTPRHAAVAAYLRSQGSAETTQSYAILGLPVPESSIRTTSADVANIRQAYLRAIRRCHPDTQQGQIDRNNNGEQFDAVVKAYRHLTLYQGRGSHRNPAHSLKYMLPYNVTTNPIPSTPVIAAAASAKNDDELDQQQYAPQCTTGAISITQDHVINGADVDKTRCERSNPWDPAAGGTNNARIHQEEEEDPSSSSSSSSGNQHHYENEDPMDFFQTRLLAVMQEFGSKGLDVSNLAKKWNQVWPQVPFPLIRPNMKLSKFLQRHAGNVIELRHVHRNSVRIFAIQNAISCKIDQF